MNNEMLEVIADVLENMDGLDYMLVAEAVVKDIGLELSDEANGQQRFTTAWFTSDM